MVGEISEDGKWLWDGNQWIPNSKFNPNQTPSTDSVNISFQDSVITEPIVTNIYNDADSISQGILKAFDELGVTSNILPSVSFMSAMEEKYNQIMNSDTEFHPKVHLTLGKYKRGPAAIKLYLGEDATFELLEAMKQVTMLANDNIRMSLRSSIKQGHLDWEYLSNITRSYLDFEITIYENLFDKKNRHKVFYESESKIISDLDSINKLPHSVATLMSNVEASDFYMEAATSNSKFGKDEETKFIEKSILYLNKALGQAKDLSLREELVSIYSDLMVRYSAVESFTLAEDSYEEGVRILGDSNLSTSVKLKFYISRGVMLRADTKNATIVHRSNNQIIIDKLCQDEGINENHSKKISDLFYDMIAEAAFNEEELPPPPSPDIAAGFSTQDSTTSNNTSRLDSIKVTVEGTSVGFTWSSALPANVKEALSAMSEADESASVDDLGKYVGISQFDEATQIKLWSVWRQRQAEFATLIGNQKTINISEAANWSFVVLGLLIGAYFAGATDLYDDYRYLETVYEENCVGGGYFADIGRDITGISGDCDEIKDFLDSKRWMLILNPATFFGAGLICIGLIIFGVEWE